MADTPKSDLARYATFGLLGAVIGGALVYFFGGSLGMESPVSGAVGGGVAGVVATFIRARAGID
ncbi:MAG: hypothetical protein AAGG69_14285 [Pseudomonadota bacterium]